MDLTFSDVKDAFGRKGCGRRASSPAYRRYCVVQRLDRFEAIPGYSMWDDSANASFASLKVIPSYESSRPNKTLEPTPTSVMPAAEQPSRRP